MIGGGKKEIILFKLDSCVHCKDFKEPWEKLNTKYKDDFKFTVYDYEINADKVKEYNICCVPSIVIKDDNKIIKYGEHKFDILDLLFSALNKN